MSPEDWGRFEIYVRPFPDVNSSRWTVSTTGGTRRSGTERSGVALRLKRGRESSPVRQAAAALIQPSVAVMPFANLGAEIENEYFSDGVAEETINALANVAG